MAKEQTNTKKIMRKTTAIDRYSSICAASKNRPYNSWGNNKHNEYWDGKYYPLLLQSAQPTLKSFQMANLRFSGAIFYYFNSRHKIGTNTVMLQFKNQVHTPHAFTHTHTHSIDWYLRWCEYFTHSAMRNMFIYYSWMLNIHINCIDRVRKPHWI